MTKKLSSVIALVTVLSMLLVACSAPAATQAPQATSPGVAPSADDREPVNIVLVAHGACSWDAFWCVVEQGNKDAARDLGVNLTIISPPNSILNKRLKILTKRWPPNLMLWV